ncbi:MAG: DNA-deoxyinosine glycosylase [Roseburia sp.]|nr:DNA-deoxyinosine glycosylase [Roseburia sp.]
MEFKNIKHTFAPVFDERSEKLILGTFPSVRSRETQFYYGHPQNRFWKVMAQITGSSLPVTVEEKKAMLLANHIAIWDVIGRCTITGSSDSSIRDVEVNDIGALLCHSNISAVYGNGAKACELYDRYVREKTGMDIVKLPSTSPANAAWSLERLCEAYGQALQMEKRV